MLLLPPLVVAFPGVTFIIVWGIHFAVFDGPALALLLWTAGGAKQLPALVTSLHHIASTAVGVTAAVTAMN